MKAKVSGERDRPEHERAWQDGRETETWGCRRRRTSDLMAAYAIRLWNTVLHFC